LRVIDDDFDQLRALVSEMGGRVETAVHDAICALVQGDAERARAVITGDARVDALALQTEQHAIRMIALRSPLADDLREVLAALKIAALVARIGDCAKNIAYRAEELSDLRKLDQVKILPAMEEAVQAMLKTALDAFASRNTDAAAAVCARDGEVDRLYAAILRALIQHMTAHPYDIGTGTHLLFVAQKLERIADHSVSIAEIVHYAVTGESMPPELSEDRAPEPAEAFA
jgi:phosphate transport system protein